MLFMDIAREIWTQWEQELELKSSAFWKVQLWIKFSPKFKEILNEQAEGICLFFWEKTSQGVIFSAHLPGSFVISGLLSMVTGNTFLLKEIILMVP